MDNYNAVERLKEFSTYEGLTVISGLIGYAVTDGQINAIGAVAVAIYGLIKIFKKEKK